LTRTKNNRNRQRREIMANQHTPNLPKIVKTEDAAVPLHEINVPESVQSRVSDFDEGAVSRYVEALEGGDKLPPIELFTWDGEDGHTSEPYFVGAGFNRIEAYRRKGVKTVPATVHVVKGGRDEAYAAAQWCSITSNATHGLPRTQADRRRAVKLAIETQPHLNDNRISKLVRVDSKTVARVRAAMLGLPDPYAEEKPPIEEGEADTLEEVREKASKAVGEISHERAEELEPVRRECKIALTTFKALATQCPGEEYAAVVAAIRDFLKRCGDKA
jgi:uncharacterized ParB-like nuclease family protein